MSSRYRRFRGYELAAELADAVRQEVTRWNRFDQWSLGIQLVRSADSIGANIAEAFGRPPGADRRRMLLIARGSATEVEHWLDRAVQGGLLADGRFDRTVIEILRLLNGLIRTERSP